MSCTRVQVAEVFGLDSDIMVYFTSHIENNYGNPLYGHIRPVSMIRYRIKESIIGNKSDPIHKLMRKISKVYHLVS